jgi:hypothetical protein
VVMAHLPQSHELRYYLCWVLVLVALCLWLWVGGEGAEGRGAALGGACAAFLGVVLWVTSAGYVYPSGTTFAELMKEKGGEEVVRGIGEGETVCLRREPYTFLYAAPFHPGRRYVVREAEGEGECEGARWVP